MTRQTPLDATAEFTPTEPLPATAAAAGTSIPGYELLGELGRGGMGVVYRARQTKLGRLVAVKMILASGHAGVAELERFRTEAEAIARLQHPNIVQIYEVGAQDGLPYFSLEYCAGGSLARHLAGTPLPPLAAAALVETLARAMQLAHAQGVLHRDLKPANILLQRGEDPRTGSEEPMGFSPVAPSLASLVPKITDFGLAKRLDEASKTTTGAVLGTPSYMAPEQAGGKSKEIGPGCDVYALGAILYECLTGRPPFRAATPLDTIMQVIADEPVPVRLLNRRVPRDLATICHKCLQKLPADRYQSAGELADDLARFQHGEPTRARPIGVVGRTWRWCKRRPLTAGLLVLAAALLVSGIGIGIALPRITHTATPRRGPVVSLNTTRVAVREWKEAEELLATTGLHAAVFKYSDGEVIFWLELESAGHTQRIPPEPRLLFGPPAREAKVIPAGMEIKELKDAPETTEGYFIWTRGNTNDVGQEPWVVGWRRSRVVRAAATTEVSAPFLEAEASQAQTTRESFSSNMSWSMPVWSKKPIDAAALQGAQMVLCPANPATPPLVRLAGHAMGRAGSRRLMRASTSEASFGAVSNPLPTNQDVRLKEIRREKRQMGLVLDWHVIRIMCRVVPEKPPVPHAKDHAK